MSDDTNDVVGEDAMLMYNQGVSIVGDGPTGLSAALFLAKNGIKNVHVFGENETYLHDAHLYNYLGIESIDGSQFADVARDQCREHGATLYTTLVEHVEPHRDGFRVTTSGGEHYGSKYIVLAEGDGRGLSEQLGVEFEELDGTDVVKADKYGRTSMENVYAGGWTIRNNKIQAVISAGDGAAIALDILSKEKDRQFHDFDVPQ
jgi:thioredoxin reductase